MTRCIGHRGAAGLAPENSLAAFQAGIAAGADAVECDVHQTRDGHLVLMHDDDVRHTTDGTGLIGEMTLADLRRLNCAARFGDGALYQQVPTLDDLLRVARGRCAVQVEIKVPRRGAYVGIESRVAAALRDHAMLDSTQVICFDALTLARVHVIEPLLTLGLLGSAGSLAAPLRDDPAALVAHAQGCGATFLGLDRAFVRSDHLRAVRAGGIDLGVWTVNEAAEMERLIGWGVQALTSDRPDMLRRLLVNRSVNC